MKMERVFDLDGTVYTQDEDRQGWTGTCNQTCNELATDCVSRQAAIDAVFGRSHDIIKQRLKNLPPVQSKIVRCKECKYHTYDNLYGFHWCNRMLGTFRVGLEDYCSFAKRGENERSDR